ncbi:HNH endonuclease signature motif containing protein [[Kitasatospora] papulosa]|uniref:HNH endonuclease signature motif containing protein n=1 Tax=[Kitasatospora] papulosa TaxID=1464011 RepID=UPI00386BC5B8
MPKQVESILFRGITFRRYPDATGRAERAYFTPGGTDRGNGVRRLHEEIWMAHNGAEIPSGHHIHHRDGNPLNNKPGNLACLSADEHASHHAGERRGSCTPEAFENLNRIRPLASDWHRSEAGRAWHVEHAQRLWESRTPVAYTCEQCGSGYQSKSRHGGERFCSNACKSAWRRTSGLDDESRNCQRCKAEFHTNKYKKTRFCGKSCSRLDSIARRRAGLESDRS